LVTLLPVIGLIQIGSHAHADRYTYVPLIGVFVALAWGAHEFTRHWPHQPLILSLAGGAVVLLCVVLARQQVGYWKENETLFQHALAVTQDNDLAHSNLGTALARQNRLDEAVAHLQEALRLIPNYPGFQNNLGTALAKQGRLDEAIPHLREAVSPMGNPPALPERLPQFDSSGSVGKGAEVFGRRHWDGKVGRVL
jgi:protein O-mannosyl-transferase